MNSARMTSPSFWRQIGSGLMLSVVGGVLYAALSPFIGSGTLLRALVVGLGAIYLALLLHDLRARIGLVVTLAGWALVTGLLCAFNPTFWVWLLAQTLVIWLLRCLYRYDSLATAIADAAVSGFALATALATASYTHSLFLTLWSWFLVQAMFVFIPPSRAPTTAAAPEPDSDDAFGQAYRTAEAALRRLSHRN